MFRIAARFAESGAVFSRRRSSFSCIYTEKSMNVFLFLYERFCGKRISRILLMIGIPDTSVLGITL